MQYLLPMDLHNHSLHSFDGSCTVSAMCEAAVSKGIGVFALTDHYEVGGFEDINTDFDASFAQAAKDVSAAKKAFAPGLQLLFGIELGEPLEDVDRAHRAIAAHPFDFVLGSLHNAPGRRDFYYYDPKDESFQLAYELECYFRGLLDIVHWGAFDSAAHITYPFRYIMERKGEPFDFSPWDDYIDAVVKALAHKGLALEINTSGLGKTPPYIMPEARWIKRFREVGGEKITIGSDAHRTENVGLGIAAGVSVAAAAGFRYLCYFSQRKPFYLPIAK